MSCGKCNCSDCQDERECQEEIKEYYAPPPPPRPTWQTIEPANAEQAKAWMGYINQVFDQYPGVRINMPALLGMVCQKIPGLRSENYVRISTQIERLIRESPLFDARKGKSGGFFRKEELPPMPNVVAVSTADNYTCKAPGCLNSKLNDKTDKSCWKCGRPVGT